MDRSARRKQLYALLGDLPAESGPPGVELVASDRQANYRLERLVLDLNGLEKVPAVFIRPAEGDGPWPTILYNHAHGGKYEIGKDEFLHGRRIAGEGSWAELLAARGIAGLCIDHWAFGERRGLSESEIFKEMLWHGRVMWGMMVYDSLRALDYLAARPDVDVDRLGTLGMSMGSTMAWWTAALDPRLKVCIDICCLTDFHELIRSRGLDGHGIYYYVPNLLKHFDAAAINALIAPRAHLALAGRYDRLTPLEGLERIDRELRREYAAAGAPQAWRLDSWAIGHVETAAMRQAALAWLDRWL